MEGKQKGQRTQLKDILARVPTSHIAPIIQLISDYCVENKLEECLDSNKERNELKALCEQRKLDYGDIDSITISACKGAIKSITKADLQSIKVKGKKALKAAPKVKAAVAAIEDAEEIDTADM